MLMMVVLDVELRCKNQSANSCSNYRRWTESSACDSTTEDPSAYLESQTFCRIHESEFFTSSGLSAIDDSIADAVDFGLKPLQT